MKIPLKPLSVNRVWQGRRFKTKEYKQYEQDCSWFMKDKKVSGWVEINYKFFLPSKTYKMSDCDNFIKPIQDIMVKNKMIDDDRFIKRFTVEKFLAKEFCVVINIKKYEE